MLVVTADDYGKTKHTTDCIFDSFSKERITSASAMVFMEDSQRAASLASGTSLEVGLHLNMTMPYSFSDVPQKLRGHQDKIRSFLGKHKLCQVIFNPFLMDAFEYIFRSEYEEFVKLYGRSPDFYNGHHHMHLCANLLLGKYIPEFALIRRTFTFNASEKNRANLLYRNLLDYLISKRYRSTDSFFSIAPLNDHNRFQKILDRATYENVEIEVHPEIQEEYDFLQSEMYQQMISQVKKCGFRNLYSS